MRKIPQDRNLAAVNTILGLIRVRRIMLQMASTVLSRDHVPVNL